MPSHDLDEMCGTGGGIYELRVRVCGNAMRLGSNA